MVHTWVSFSKQMSSREVFFSWGYFCFTATSVAPIADSRAIALAASPVVAVIKPQPLIHHAISGYSSESQVHLSLVEYDSG